LFLNQKDANKTKIRIPVPIIINFGPLAWISLSALWSVHAVVIYISQDFHDFIFVISSGDLELT